MTTAPPPYAANPDKGGQNVLVPGGPQFPTAFNLYTNGAFSRQFVLGAHQD